VSEAVAGGRNGGDDTGHGGLLHRVEQRLLAQVASRLHHAQLEFRPDHSRHPQRLIGVA
jgi:hypothetical protein